MRCGHLFNGIGGFALAAHWMGWANVMHCEIDPFCNKVMNKHFPNSYQHEDIRTTDFTIWRGKLDLITGGFPCQPYSTAGKRKGKDDDRHLWPEMLRAIREIQPGWIVGENVRGLTNWNGGLVFDEVQYDLETEGYEVLPFLLPACSVNAPHRRDRIWFVAHNKANIREGSNRRCGELQFFKSMVVEGTQAGLCISNREIERARKEVENNFNAQAFDECAEGGRSGSQESKQVRQSDGESSNSKPLYKRAQQGEGGWSAQAEGKEQMVCTDLCQQSEDSYRVFRYERGGFEGKDSGGNKAWNYTCFQWPIAYSANTRPESMRSREDEIHEYGSIANTECIRLPVGNDQQDRRGAQSIVKRFYSIGDWQDFPTQPPICDRNDGLPFGLVDIAFSKWRNESLKALGNAIVPQVAYQIFKAIEQYARQTS